MIRFIIKRQFTDGIINCQWDEYHTIDLDVPELERILKTGGHGESGADIPVLIGCEVREATND